jgi:hypothetical protein
MIWKELSLWTKMWIMIIAFFIVYPIGWFVIETLKGSTLLYETGVTFTFFFGLASIFAVIWGIGIWVKSLKK